MHDHVILFETPLRSELTKCNPRVSPCCVRRARPLWPVRCEHLRHGCGGADRLLAERGLYVQDKRALAAAKAGIAMMVVLLAALSALAVRRDPRLRNRIAGAVKWRVEGVAVNEHS